MLHWRTAELAALGVTVRLNTYAEQDQVLAEQPDVVIVATGGIPDVDWMDGAELVTSSWDFLTGAAPIKDDVLVYDGTGRNPAMSCAERAAIVGKKVALVALDGSLGPEMTFAERNTWKEKQYQLNIPVSYDLQLRSIEQAGNALAVHFENEVTWQRVTMTADQIVVERGTLPADEIFHQLRAASCNDGVTDIDSLLAGRAQPKDGHSAGFALHRIGDAVASRNVYSAILDAARLCNTI